MNLLVGRPLYGADDGARSTAEQYAPPVIGGRDDSIAGRLDQATIGIWAALDPAERRLYETWCLREPERIGRRVELLGWALGEFASGPRSSLGPLTLRDLADRHGPAVFGPGDMRAAIREDRALGVREDRAFGGGAVTFLRLSRGGRDAVAAWRYPAPCRLDDTALVWLEMNPWESVSEVVDFVGRW